MRRSLNVLLGVTGGISAVKAPELVRRLRERNHQVRCILTRHADSFVAPLALEVLSGRPLYREQYLEPNDSSGEMHVDAARWADVLCIAPTTCNTLARLALGLADDFLATTTLVFEGPVILAPAMNSEMWHKGVVQENLQRLVDRGVRTVGPASGPLASGEIGMGRMAEPVEILAAIEAAVRPSDLEGVTVLVTAGPTREPIDSVRFLSNRSSGKMGFSLAEEAASRGARVRLVAGPVSLPTPSGSERTDVGSALEMERAVKELAPSAALIIMTAAVADFRPAVTEQRKLKKGDGPPAVELVANPDILPGLADLAPAALRVGFAAETGDLEAEATRKLKQKRVHFIVANDVSRDDIGFGSSENEVVVYRQDGDPQLLSRQSKRQLAAQLMDLFVEALRDREGDAVSSCG